MGTIAEDYWVRNTLPWVHPEPSRRHIAIGENFREKDGAIAWIVFSDSRIDLKKIEAISPHLGNGKKLLKFIITICDEYNLSLTGNAVPYNPSDPSQKEDLPKADFDRLKKWYENCGIAVEGKHHHLRYPNHSGTSINGR